MGHHRGPKPKSPQAVCSLSHTAANSFPYQVTAGRDSLLVFFCENVCYKALLNSTILLHNQTYLKMGANGQCAIKLNIFLPAFGWTFRTPKQGYPHPLFDFFENSVKGFLSTS